SAPFADRREESRPDDRDRNATPRRGEVHGRGERWKRRRGRGAREQRPAGNGGSKYQRHAHPDEDRETVPVTEREAEPARAARQESREIDATERARKQPADQCDDRDSGHADGDSVADPNDIPPRDEHGGEDEDGE